MLPSLARDAMLEQDALVKMQKAYSPRMSLSVATLSHHEFPIFKDDKKRRRAIQSLLLFPELRYEGHTRADEYPVSWLLKT